MNNYFQHAIYYLFLSTIELNTLAHTQPDDGTNQQNTASSFLEI